MPVQLRPAILSDAAELSSVALRSKAYWGYSAEFLRACRATLHITPVQIRDDGFTVAVRDDVVVGFSRLVGNADLRVSLQHLWVVPEAIGTGVGRVLWREAVRVACAGGFAAIDVMADPHAVGFYRAMGAVHVEDVASESVAGRVLPLLRCPVRADS